jgi:SAM-dependent methyltransferase
MRIRSFSLLLLTAPFASAFFPQFHANKPFKYHLFFAKKKTTQHLVSSKHNNLTESFLSNLHTALNRNEFINATFHGQKTPTRGAIRRVQARVIQDQTLQFTFKFHLATDIIKNVPLRNTTIFHQLLYNNTAAVASSEWGPVPTQWHRATLETTDRTFHVDFQRAKLSIQKATRFTNTTAAIVQPHDRIKHRAFNSADSAAFRILGVTNDYGEPRAGMRDKVRQCAKGVEVIGNLLRSYQPASVSVLDLGCGRGYLTVATHEYLKQHYTTVKVKGIDVRPKLVQELNQLVKTLELQESLVFEQGTIEDVVIQGAAATIDSINTTIAKHDHVSIVMALHACDTATDDAIWAGIQQQAHLIIVAPCCHQQLRRQINILNLRNHPLADVLKHGIYRERTTETVTDALRALFLELAGYKTQVFEFIGGEHTAKNCMITAVKRNTTVHAEQQQQSVRERIRTVATFYGITEHKLASWMGESLGGVESVPLSVNKMPPL